MECFCFHVYLKKCIACAPNTISQLLYFIMKLNIFKWINERKILSKLNWRWIENITKNLKVVYTQGQSLGNTHLVWNFHLPYLKLLRSPFYAGFEGAEEGRASESKNLGLNVDFPLTGCGSYSLLQPHIAHVGK